MAFTYNESVSADRDRIRLQIGDTVVNEGPRPNKRNFSDAELNALITAEGTWQRTTAACYEILASEWASKVTFSAYGGSYTRSDASRAYQALADEWREKYGRGDAAGGESATEELGFKDVDFSGGDVVPLFQREAFGNKVKDWDPD